MIKTRDGFSSKMGVIAAAAGSAIGLGNIWKFPYVSGENGGAAFILVYLIFTFFVGLPVLLSAFVIGRSTQQNAVGAFKTIAPKSKWHWIGGFSLFAALLLISFYSVVAGWTTQYVFLALTDQLSFADSIQYKILFETIVSDPSSSIMWMIIFMAFTVLIVMSGIKEGIERSAKVLMPLLFVLLLILAGRSMSLPGADEGIRFLLEPDFTKLTGRSILTALGQAFFSLSVGVGVMIIYGSYIKKDVNLSSTTIKISVADISIAVLAGLAIFPAVFAYGVNPSEGPGLVFITLPQVFEYMPAGYAFSLMFFVLLFIAALTSAISMIEVLVSFVVEEYEQPRKMVLAKVSALVILLGSVCAMSSNLLSEVQILGLSIFDSFDYLVSNLAMPIGSFAMLVLVGWKMDQRIVGEELGVGKFISARQFTIVLFLIKYISPLAVMIIFLQGIGIIA